MREQPEQAAKAVTCLADGTIVALDLQGESLFEGGQRTSYTVSASGPWVLVTTPGGLRGWVSPAYLGWAT